MTIIHSATEQSVCIFKPPGCVYFEESWTRFPVILGALKSHSAYDNQSVYLILILNSRKTERFLPSTMLIEQLSTLCSVVFRFIQGY